MLVSASQSFPRLSRLTRFAIASAALAVCLLPTFRRAPAQAQTKPAANAIRRIYATSLPTSAAAPKWGNLKGQFLFEGKAPVQARINVAAHPQLAGLNVVDERLIVDAKTHGIKNVVIYVSSIEVAIHPDYEKTAKDKVLLDHNNCRFDPHVAMVRTSQTLEFRNSDPFSHNANMSPLGDMPANLFLARNASFVYKFSKSQKLPVPVTSNIYPWMRAYIIVRDDPYAAVCDDEGKFEFKNLPTGKLEFTVWHETSGWLKANPEWEKGKFTIEIKPGDNDLGAIQVPDNLFK